MMFDYAIIGGGAAGCVLAARLSECGRFNILLLEAGLERKSPLLKIPAGETLLMGNPNYDWCYKTKADPSIGGRSVSIPRGKLLGGSNLINGMIFVRGQQADYDDWKAAGCAGWGFSDVLPYFKKIERVEAPFGQGRGHAGPVSVTVPKAREQLAEAFVRAGEQAGYPLNPDYNDAEQEGFGLYQATIRNGVRSSAFGAYLVPARTCKNLTVLTGVRAGRLIFNEKTCTGVEIFSAAGRQEIAVKREVILAAGTVESPKLLELSGIGAPAILQAAGIPLRVALRGVGENFRDHYAVRMKWRVRGAPSFNERSRGLALAGEIVKYISRRKGLLSLPIALAHGFVRSRPELARPDLQYHFAPASYGPASSRRLDQRPGMTVGLYPLRPRSAGSIHVGSADPHAPPQIRPRFLDDPEDIEVLVRGMGIARRIMGQPAISPYVEEELSPGAAAVDDAALTRFAVEAGDTSYHPVGTCRMGSDAGAVVDSRLRVHGVSGLRVVDASVMPMMVSGNTNAATLMIAEKGAAMILQDAQADVGHNAARAPEMVA
jgi:choline dehydrogenase